MKQEQLKIISEYVQTRIKDSLNNFSTSPFKHYFIDNFFPEDFANQCLNYFPDTKDLNQWETKNDKDIEIKMRSNWKSEFDIPDVIIDAIRILNSSLFMLEVSKIFDIHKIIPDPYYTGGGLNVTKKGGLLDVHVDGNYHDATGLDRRLNAILYLNKNWIKNWGGEFGLYDKEGKKCLKKIDPIFNRLVIFDTHDFSYHGLPDPVNFPDDSPRKSIILYYYTKEKRPTNQILSLKPHSALWVKKDKKDKKGNIEREFS
ncbi:2OG-Fe(II) oxygenase [Alphaproteobacteria bacterium]|nr:2OG-Fe(II) oxygenase [Alphaproteobacteria bacterium]